ncbi:MAG: hypothetical protein RLZZ338_174 [Cyanobacteriota bacterium]|jgi:hypothetical protein
MRIAISIFLMNHKGTENTEEKIVFSYLLISPVRSQGKYHGASHFRTYPYRDICQNGMLPVVSVTAYSKGKINEKTD